MTIRIEVRPIDKKKCGVYLDGQLVGQSKHSFACDWAAHKLAGLYEDADVDLHAELRPQWLEDKSKTP